VIGLLYDNPKSDYVAEVQVGSLAVCRERGYHLLIHPCNPHTPGFVDEVLDLHRQATVDGFISLQPVSEHDGLNRALVEAGVSFVRVSQRRREGASLVSVDDEQAAARMTRHLLELGHRRIGFILGLPDQGSSHDRLAGYHSAIAEAGLVFEPVLVEQGLYNYESGYSAARRLLALEPAPTAIFASNDHMAMGVLTAAHEQGLKIPDDLSVAGFDDSPMARFAWPPLTTVRQPITQVARLATEQLVLRLEQPDAPIRHFVLHSDLVRRASTGPSPGSA
jgi:LacI family transcriptional regulator